MLSLCLQLANIIQGHTCADAYPCTVFPSSTHIPRMPTFKKKRGCIYVVGSAPIVLHGPERCVSGAELIGLTLSSMCLYFPLVVSFPRGYGVVNRVSVCNTGSSIPITPQSPKCWNSWVELVSPAQSVPAWSFVGSTIELDRNYSLSPED